MARFHGNVGYGVSVNQGGGVWRDEITERPYYGEILDEQQNLVVSDNVNDDIRLTQRISVVADAFAVANFLNIKYVDWSGVLWVVNSTKVEHPRLVLSLGGVYDGPRPTA